MEVLGLFFQTTKRLWYVIPEHTCFEYLVGETKYIIQFVRQQGNVLILKQDQSPNQGVILKPKTDHRYFSLTRKLVEDIEHMFDDDPDALENLVWL